MHIEQILTAALVLFGIFCCIIVPTWLFIRQHGMKGDIAELITKMQTAMTDYARFCTEAADIYKKITMVDAEMAAAKTRDASTQETIRNLGNKFNSRLRTERQHITYPETETQPIQQEGGMEKNGDLNFEQLALQFPGSVIPLTKQQPAVDEPPQPRERRFGELP